MRRIVLLALLSALIASNCHALTGARLRMTQLSCTAPITGETGDSGNYFSGWALTGGACGTLWYKATWDSAEGSWEVWLYSNSGMTNQLGYGITYGTSTVTIAGTVHGTVTVADGVEGITLVEGTLTR